VVREQPSKVAQFSLAGRVGGAIERTVAKRFEFAPKQFVIREEL